MRSRTVRMGAAAVAAATALCGFSVSSLAVPAKAVTGGVLSARTVTGPVKSQSCETAAKAVPCLAILSNPAATMKPQGQAKMAPAAALTYPSQCEAAVEADSGATYPDRFTSCSSWTYPFSVLDPEDPSIVIGEIPVKVTQWIADDSDTFEAGANQWTHGVIVNVGSGSGVLSGGATADFNTRCYTDETSLCKVVGGGGGSSTPILFTPGSTHTASWTEADNGSSATTPNEATEDTSHLGVTWLFTYGGSSVEADDNGSSVERYGSPGDAAGTGLANRCDSDTDYPTSSSSEVPAADACVDDQFIPTLVYDATRRPKVGPVADHVYAAQKSMSQHWGVPSSGNALTRATKTRKKENREAACPRSLPPPVDWVLDEIATCDEYPMASTNQGGAGASIAWVPKSANDSQGATTKNFYSANRIKTGTDKFWVKAILANGTTSW